MATTLAPLQQRQIYRPTSAPPQQAQSPNAPKPPQQMSDANAQATPPSNVYRAPASPVAPVGTGSTGTIPPPPPPGTTPPANLSAPASGTAPPNNINFSDSADDSNIHSTYYDAANQWANQGSAINSEAQQNQNYYGGLSSAEQQQSANYADPIGANPGYAAPLASQINQNYSQYVTPTSQLNQQYLSPTEQAEISGNPSTAVSAAQTGVANTGQELNAYQANLGQQAQQGQSYLSANLPTYNGQLSTALNGETGAVDSSLSGEQTSLGNATTGQANSILTPTDVNTMATEAGATVGNAYQAQMDQVKRQAQAAGNTSPLALAAAENRLTTEQAGAVGNAVANARLGAQQAEYGEQAQLAGENIGSAETLGSQQQIAGENMAGQQIGAATSQQQAAANAAAQSANLGLTAAEASGQAGLQEQENAANTLYGAANTADVNSSERAAEIAAARTGTAANISGEQFNQGTTAGQLTSQGAQAVGNAQMGQQQEYLNYLTGEQQLGEQGQLTAEQQQIANLQAESGAVNQDVLGRGNYQIGNNGVAASEAGGLINSITGAGSAGASAYKAFAAKGETVGSPTPTLVGEHAPEFVFHEPSVSKESLPKLTGPSSPYTPRDSAILPRAQNIYRSSALRIPNPTDRIPGSHPAAMPKMPGRRNPSQLKAIYASGR